MKSIILFASITTVIAIARACTDTPSWDDGDGETCPDYRTNYCFDNIASVAGPFWNYPELNCCGCGKVEKIRGFMLGHLKQRSTNRCASFMKPGADPEAAEAQAESACGCIKEGGMVVSCRDIGEHGCKPTATIDCKEAVQELNDVWIEGQISDNICRKVRRFMQLLADTCMI